ncbi:MAG: hypothetical protein WBH28_04375, partial [Fuerstiella sp.]
VVAPSSILESSTDAPDDRQLKNLKFQTPLATTKNGFPDTLLAEGACFYGKPVFQKRYSIHTLLGDV